MQHLYRAIIVTFYFVVLPIAVASCYLHHKGQHDRQPRPTPAPVVAPATTPELTWDLLEGREVPLDRFRLPIPDMHCTEQPRVTL